MSQQQPNRVWIVYNDVRKNMDDAERFGELKNLFYGRVDYGRAVEHARKMLSGWKPGDYVLMVGDPTLCFIVGKVAAECAEIAGDETVKILRWSKNDAEYQEMTLDFNEQQAEEVGEAEVVRKRG